MVLRLRIKLAALASFAVAITGLSEAALGEAEPTAQQEALMECVVMRTTGADRVLTSQWLFVAMAHSPHIASLSAIPDERKVDIDKAFGELMVRLAVKDCFDEMLPLVAQDSEGAFYLLGAALGEIAMQELMADEKVGKAVEKYADYLSEEDLKPLNDAIEKDQSK